jgi:hypothetical protein
LPSLAWGGWLKVPWTRVMLSPKPEVLDDLLGPATRAQVGRTRIFRDYFTQYLLGIIVAFTSWIGAVVGVYAVSKRGSLLDAPWGFVAGAAAGMVISATIGCILIVFDLVPHLIWDLSLRGQSGGFLWLFVWVALTLVWWTMLGVLLGVGLTFLGPMGRPFLYPLQIALSGLFRLVFLRRLSAFFAPM